MRLLPDLRGRSWKYRLFRIAGGGALCYSCLVLILFFAQGSLLYVPTKAAPGSLKAEDPRVVDVHLTTAEGTSIHGWWAPLDSWRPEDGAVLYCHGNGGNIGHREPIIGWVHAGLKQPILMFDYPGYGCSDGRPSEHGCYQSADAAYDWLVQEEKVPPDRILLYGGSLGGAVAVDLASRRPYRALVLVDTFTSMPKEAQDVYPWLPCRYLVREQFDSLSKIKDCYRPIFIAHTAGDSLISASHGRRLFEAANEPKYFLEVPGSAHDEALTPPSLRVLGDFLNDVAK
jgi:fermentation-respiration switch protein FrsA (DUF1100 family)